MKVTFEQFAIHLLNAACDPTGFDCGYARQNQWLHDRAIASHETGDARCYVACHPPSIMRGFYALTPASILRGSLPGSLRRNAPEPVGAILLAQLAVDRPCQGAGLGYALMHHAMRQAVRMAEIGGGRLFAVHPARVELVPWYARLGFVAADAAPALMAMPMEKVRRIVARVAGD